MVLVIKNPPANAGDVRDSGLIPGSGRSPNEGVATHSRILAWRIPWTEEPGGLQPTASQTARQLKQFSTQAHVCECTGRKGQVSRLLLRVTGIV